MNYLNKYISELKYVLFISIRRIINRSEKLRKYFLNELYFIQNEKERSENSISSIFKEILIDSKS